MIIEFTENLTLFTVNLFYNLFQILIRFESDLNNE